MSNSNPDVGLQKFVKDVFVTTGLSLLSTLIMAQLLTTFTILNPMMFLGLGFLGSILGLIGVSVTTPSFYMGLLDVNYFSPPNRHIVKYSTNPSLRLVAYGVFMMGMSTMLSPLMFILSQVEEFSLLPLILALTILLMGTAMMFAYYQPQNQVLSWKAPLMSGLSCLCFLGLFNLICQLFPSLHLFGEGLHTIDLYGGIVLFTLFVVYDCHVAVNQYQNGLPDHLGCAIGLYLDFINLFVRIAEIVIKNRDKIKTAKKYLIN